MTVSNLLQKAYSQTRERKRPWRDLCSPECIARPLEPQSATIKHPHDRLSTEGHADVFLANGHLQLFHRGHVSNGIPTNIIPLPLLCHQEIIWVDTGDLTIQLSGKGGNLDSLPHQTLHLLSEKVASPSFSEKTSERTYFPSAADHRPGFRGEGRKFSGFRR